MFQACLARVQNAYTRLTPVERKLADFVFAEPLRVVGMTIGELSDEVRVAPSGVTRFCKRLGYQGYPELKIHLAGEISSQSEVILPAISPNDDTDTVFNKVFQSSMKTLKDTLALLDRDLTDRAVTLLHDAQRIEFYGIGTSGTIAIDAYYRLMRIGYPAGCATDLLVMRMSAAGLGPGQVAVGVSHTGRTNETRQALRLARERGADTIAITSFQGSPICREADIVLCVYSEESLYRIGTVSAKIGHIAVLDALCVALALKEHERTVERIAVMNRLLGDMRHPE